MDRTRPPKGYLAPCGIQVEPVDQNMWQPRHYPWKQGCPGSLYTPTYNCNGNISYTLPLEKYPSLANPYPRPQPPFENSGTPFARTMSMLAQNDIVSRRISPFYYE